MKYTRPELNKPGFHCPNPECQFYAHQTWGDIQFHYIDVGRRLVDNMPKWKGALCNHCKKISLWQDKKLIFPLCISVPLPNEDLETDIKKDYNEAALIVEVSPKAAAALLRLAIQKLCKQLGEDGKDLNKNIGELVKKGLPPDIQKALDIVRVIGNESVHPGQINLDDDKDIAYRLFELINIIAQTMITQPKKISKMFDSLPKKKLESIKKRDA